MPYFQSGTASIYYEFEDLGHSETLLFSNSLGTDLTMWDRQEMLLRKRFNILRYDTRGHGKSDATAGDYPIALLGNDVTALIEHLHLTAVIFCGLSIGGLTGQWLGIHAPGYFSHIILSNTAARIGTANGWNERITTVRKDGLASILKGTEARWFTPGFIKENPDAVQKILETFVHTDTEGYCSCCAAVRDADFTRQLSGFKVPALVISGTEDSVTTIADGQFLQDHIPNASMVSLKAAHISSIEQAGKFAEAVLNFIPQK